MKIATWNINSVRLRIEQVLKFIHDQNIDVLCLQETKTEDQFFPSEKFSKIGIKYQYFRGEKSYNGVAILSKTKLKENGFINFCEKSDCRHISVKLGEKIELHNFYVPAGGDEPDTSTNPKFAHKIDFLNEMNSYFRRNKKTQKILVGDLNIAPMENDVWSHKQLLNVVSHTPIETEALLDMIVSGEWIDVMREIVLLILNLAYQRT